MRHYLNKQNLNFKYYSLLFVHARHKEREREREAEGGRNSECDRENES